MHQSERSYEKLVERFVEWAETRPDIRAAVIVGSRGRVDHPADEWADLDVILVTTNKERYLSTTDWIRNIGNPLLTFLEPTAWGDEMERRVLFEGMLDVDFSIIPQETAHKLLRAGISQQTARQIADTFGRGMRVLIDKDGMVERLRALVSSIEAPPPRRPTQHEFLEAVNDFLYHAVFTAKHLRRGELGVAGTCCNCHMQGLLLRMIEWHARAKHGWNYDTWFRGRFLEEWADPCALEGSREAFARYDKQDVGRALLATMDLFRWMAIETAGKLGYQYSTDADEHVSEWVRDCLLTMETSKPR